MAGMAENGEIAHDILGNDLVLSEQGGHLPCKRMVQIRLGDNQRPLIMPGKLLIKIQWIGHIKTIPEITDVTGSQMDHKIVATEPVDYGRLNGLIEVWQQEGLGDAVGMNFQIVTAED